MDQATVQHYLKSGVKRFCFLFNIDFDKKLFRKDIASLGYKLIDITDPTEFKVVASRAVMFQKPFYWMPYDSAVWAWTDKNKIAYPFVMEAADKRCKAADEFQGPTEANILAGIRQALEAKNCKFDPGGWKALQDQYRSKSSGRIEDPEAFYNSAYSIGLQAEVVNQKTVQDFLGIKNEIWDLFNGLVAKQKVATLKAMYLIVTDKEADDICAGLMTMLSKLIDVADAKKKGESSDEYAARKNIHPYKAKMSFQQASLLTLNRQRELLDLLLTIQVKLRSLGSKSAFKPSEIFKQHIIYFLES